MQGKIALITGATSGIGLVTARELARQGARVVLVGRNSRKCEDVVASIRRETGSLDVESLVGDLAQLAEVRRVADAFRARHDRLDVLVNNAGAMFSAREETEDGIERTFALNHLAYFLLTNLLLDPLRAASPSRVVSVSSDAHRSVPGLNWDDLGGKARYRPFLAYCQSKLANILFTRELARRLEAEGSGVTANALHPGFVATSIFEGPGLFRLAARAAAKVLAISPEKGAQTSIYLASAPEVAGVSGRYFEKCKPVDPSKAARDDVAARRLWDLSAEMTHLDPARPTA